MNAGWFLIAMIGAACVGASAAYPVGLRNGRADRLKANVVRRVDVDTARALRALPCPYAIRLVDAAVGCARADRHTGEHRTANGYAWSPGDRRELFAPHLRRDQ